MAYKHKFAVVLGVTSVVGLELKGFPVTEELSAQHTWCVEQENLFVAETLTRKALWDAVDFPVCKAKFEAEESAGWGFFGMTTLVMLVFALVFAIQGTDNCAAVPWMQDLLKFCGAEKNGEGADEVDIGVVTSENVSGDMGKVNEVRPKLDADSASSSAVNDAVTEGKIQSSTKWSTTSDGQVSAPDDEQPMDFSSMLLISGGIVCTLVLFAVVCRRRRRSRGSARSRQRGSLVVVGKRRGKFHDIV